MSVRHLQVVSPPCPSAGAANHLQVLVLPRCKRNKRRMQNRIGLKTISKFHLQMPCFHLQVAARHLQPVSPPDAKAASEFFYRCFDNNPTQAIPHSSTEELCTARPEETAPPKRTHCEGHAYFFCLSGGSPGPDAVAIDLRSSVCMTCVYFYRISTCKS